MYWHMLWVHNRLILSWRETEGEKSYDAERLYNRVAGMQAGMPEKKASFLAHLQHPKALSLPQGDISKHLLNLPGFQFYV